MEVINNIVLECNVIIRKIIVTVLLHKMWKGIIY